MVLNECAGVFQYAQTVFEGLKAYTTEDGRIVTFRPDLNAERMMDSAKRLEMPAFPKDRFLDAVTQTVKANAAWVPPFGSGATLYVRPYMLGSSPVIGVSPAKRVSVSYFDHSGRDHILKAGQSRSRSRYLTLTERRRMGTGTHQGGVSITL